MFWDLNKPKSTEKQLSEELKSLKSRIATFQGINDDLIGLLDLDQILYKTTKAVVDQFGGASPSIVLYDEAAKVLRVNLSSIQIPAIAYQVAKRALGDAYEDLKIPVDDPAYQQNLIIQAFKTMQIQESSDFYSIGNPFLSKATATIISSLIGSKKIVCIPLIVKNMPIGVLNIVLHKATLSPEETTTLKTFASQITLAVYNSKMYADVQSQLQQLQYKNRQQNIIFRITNTLASSLEPSEVIQLAVDLVPKEMGYMGAAILIYKPLEKTLAIEAVTRIGIPKPLLQLIPTDLSSYKFLPDDETNQELGIVRAFKTGDIVVTERLDETFFIDNNLIGNIAQALNTKAFVNMAIKMDNQIIGVIVFGLSDKAKAAVTNDDLDLMKVFTTQVELSLKNARLVREIRNNQQKERDMMDIIGHELRTPLSIIRITIGLLNEKIKKVKDGTEQEDWNKYVVRIDEALEREVKLLETMLSSTKLESNKMELHLEKVDLNRIIQDSILAIGNRAQKKGLQLKYTPSAINLALYADQVRFAEVVDNLVVNAIKYTEKGFVEIKTYEEGDFVKVAISDSGIGIPESEIPHLGEKFYRVGQYTGRLKDSQKRENLQSQDLSLGVVRPGGTGLGLYVSFNLMHLMGGDIEVQSEEGKGSTFIIKIPKYTNQPEINSGNAHEKDLFKRLGFT
jgi:signal transduction histidine kinase